jgi:hypothetical protein
VAHRERWAKDMSALTEVVFQQERSLSTDILVLRHDRVVIRNGAIKDAEEQHVRLDDISPEIEFTERRFTGVFWVLVIFAAIFAAAAWKVAGPGWFSIGLAILFGSLSFSSLIGGYVTCDPITVATVKSKGGELLFILYRHQNVAATYEEFLLQLRRRLAARCDAQ